METTLSLPMAQKFIVCSFGTSQLDTTWFHKEKNICDGGLIGSLGQPVDEEGNGQEHAND